MGEIESPTKLPGAKKALSTLYSDQVSAVKKSVKSKIDAAMTDQIGNEKRLEDNEDLKNMAEMWERDKAKKKEEIAKISTQLEDTQKELEGKDEEISKAKQETEDVNELMRFQSQENEDRVDVFNSRLAV